LEHPRKLVSIPATRINWCSEVAVQRRSGASRDLVGMNTNDAEASVMSQPIMPLALAAEIADRMIGLFLMDEHEHRACFGRYRMFQEDSHGRDYLVFNEYYNADTR